MLKTKCKSKGFSLKNNADGKKTCEAVVQGISDQKCEKICTPVLNRDIRKNEKQFQLTTSEMDIVVKERLIRAQRRFLQQGKRVSYNVDKGSGGTSNSTLSGKNVDDDLGSNRANRANRQTTHTTLKTKCESTVCDQKCEKICTPIFNRDIRKNQEQLQLNIKKQIVVEERLKREERLLLQQGKRVPFNVDKGYGGTLNSTWSGKKRDNAAGSNRANVSNNVWSQGGNTNQDGRSGPAGTDQVESDLFDKENLALEAKPEENFEAMIEETLPPCADSFEKFIREDFIQQKKVKSVSSTPLKRSPAGTDQVESDLFDKENLALEAKPEENFEAMIEEILPPCADSFEKFIREDFIQQKNFKSVSSKPLKRGPAGTDKVEVFDKGNLALEAKSDESFETMLKEILPACADSFEKFIREDFIQQKKVKNVSSEPLKRGLRASSCECLPDYCTSGKIHVLFKRTKREIIDQSNLLKSSSSSFCFHSERAEENAHHITPISVTCPDVTLPIDISKTELHIVGPKLLTYERTVAIIRPEAMIFKDVVLRAIARSGLEIVNRRNVELSPEQISEIYNSQLGSLAFPELVLRTAKKPCLILSLVGINAVNRWKALVYPQGMLHREWFFPPSMMRKFGFYHDSMGNTLHASENSYEANAENRYFFSDDILEPIPYQKHVKDYCIKYINPFLSKALAAVERSHPSDPVTFLAEYLLIHNPYQPKTPRKYSLAK